MMGSTVYVRVSRNSFQVRNIDDKREAAVTAASPFSTTRLLVGDFVAAEACLKDGIRKVYKGAWFSAAPTLVMHPLELIEGGLSPIEERILRELALSAGARRSVVWIGHELSDQEVSRRASSGSG